MGKYTDLARVADVTPPREANVDNDESVNINSINKTTTPPPVSCPSAQVTNLRTTNLTNLSEDEVWIATPARPRYTSLIGKADQPGDAVVPCIHGITSDACAVCSGYARWLIEDDSRLSAARSNPEAMRRQYRASLKGGAA